ncbi:SDR family oxidoreductase [Mucilaginibacter terrae]|uniref:Nucleoside-diphosphate-sugar epimerase n=1 Tax=Mucilaginibacter terrae TaxID=1955052 RepID=A0ABU3GMR2_9SPHI|nr:SDR family oxidoreductase [Mucilaginibacter terrae]MDT3401072.1 nucleoside-diphosphate-sugar epimerase [Mucilaginibacter terrae]
MRIISILGCGWYGLAVGNALAQVGYSIKGSTTSPERFDELEAALIHPYQVNITGSAAVYDNDFFNCDTLIISIPPKLRKGEHEEYLLKIEQLIAVLKKHHVKQLIFISSTGVYPEVNAEVDEDTPIQPDSGSSKVLLSAENLFKQETGFLTSIIRFGGLVGPGRHPGRFFAGKTGVANGRAPVNLIHLHDCIGITEAILQHQAYGHVFNACTPNHPQKQEFYILAAKHAGLPLPSFNDELGNWKIVNCKSSQLLLNYDYTVKNWADCFAENLF